jgi:hypothetical protein
MKRLKQTDCPPVHGGRSETIVHSRTSSRCEEDNMALTTGATSLNNASSGSPEATGAHNLAEADENNQMQQWFTDEMNKRKLEQQMIGMSARQ